LKRFAVVGHVEWVDFLTVSHVPGPGEIVNAGHSWAEAAGGGAVAVVQLAKLAGSALFFTALGNDDLGRRSEAQLSNQGIELVATPRARDALEGSGVELDALVRSASDSGEQDDPERLGYSARLIVTTEGPQGGTYVGTEGRTGHFEAAPLDRPIADAYGAGDSFAAGLTYGLGAGLEVREALGIAARCGAGNLTGRGPYAGQPTAADLDVPPLTLER
jgi:sugar/nucleoside kinase (ribokinase family)